MADIMVGDTFLVNLRALGHIIWLEKRSLTHGEEERPA